MSQLRDRVGLPLSLLLAVFALIDAFVGAWGRAATLLIVAFAVGWAWFHRRREKGSTDGQ